MRFAHYDELMRQRAAKKPKSIGFTLPTDLLDAFHRGEGVLWLGAGTSVSSGLPTWRNLIEQMVGCLNRVGAMQETALTHDDSYLDIAEFFRNTVGSNEYYSFLRAQIAGRSIDTIWSVENATLLAIAETANRFWPKPGLAMVSTNYDNLLEDLLRIKHAKKVRAIISDSDLATASFGKELSLIKPHGDISQPDSLILTFSDYCTFGERKSSFAKALRELFATRTVLFIGYGVGDFTFNVLLGSLVSRYGGFKRSAYTITTRISPAKRSALAAIGVRAIEIDTYEKVPQLLRAVSNNEPAVDDSRSQTSIPQFMKEALEGKTLLLIDDSTYSLASRAEELRDVTKLQITELSDSGESIKLLRRKRFDFIVTDLAMPVHTGFDVIRDARNSKLNRNSTIVVVSAFDDFEMKSRAIQAGADSFFTIGGWRDPEASAIVTALYSLNRIRQRSSDAVQEQPTKSSKHS
jgi:CheY-like chemotaxis protein